MQKIKDSKFESPSFICLGEALVDRLGPPGGDPALIDSAEDCLGGAPANVACGLAKLGSEVAFIGRLGDDSFGNRFTDLMNSRSVNLIGLQKDLIRPTRVVLVRRDLAGERIFQGFQGDQGKGFSDQALCTNELKKTWPLTSQKASWLVIGSIPLASSLSSEALLWAVKNACNQGIKIALDINWRPTFWKRNFSENSCPDSFVKNKINYLLTRISLLKLSKEEAIWFFDTNNPSDIAESMPQNPDIVVTDGANPLRWFINGFSGKMEALTPKHIVDTTGAGDAFMAGLLHQLFLNETVDLTPTKLNEVIRFAAACGAYTCRSAGAINPQPNQIEVAKFLNSF